MFPCNFSYVTANLLISILKVIDALGHEKLVKQNGTDFDLSQTCDAGGLYQSMLCIPIITQVVFK